MFRHREFHAEVAAVGVVVADVRGELGAAVGAAGLRVAGEVGLDLDAIDPQLLPQELLPAADVEVAGGQTADDRGAAVDTGRVELLNHADEQPDLAHTLGLAALDQRDQALDEGLVAGVAGLLGGIIGDRWLAAGAGLVAAGAGLVAAGLGAGGRGVDGVAGLAGSAAGASGLGAGLGALGVGRRGLVVTAGGERRREEAEREVLGADRGIHGLIPR